MTDNTANLTRGEEVEMRNFGSTVHWGFMNDKTLVQDFEPRALRSLKAKGLVKVGRKWVTITDAGRKVWASMNPNR